MVSDFVSGVADLLNETFTNLFAGAATSCVEKTCDILGTTYSDTTSGDSSLVNTMLVTSPEDFTGTTAAPSAGTGIWVTIEAVCNNAIVPIAGGILVIILLADLITTVINGNNFKEFDDSIFIKWIIKAVCGILLVSNTYYIASGLLVFGTSAVSTGINRLFNYPLTNISSDQINDLCNSLASNNSVGELIVIWFLTLLIMAAVFVLTVIIVLVMASRMIEIFMYLGIGPIPMATFMNPSWSDVGKGWIKNILALSFQGFFIVIALGIFKSIFNNVINIIITDSSGIFMSLLMLAGYTGALCFTVFRSGSISKSVFCAS
ncbi:MAG: type IV secretion system protein [Ruminococcus sp.]|nr:type IV secretion system protein [Ruminococcus sp.]